MTENSLEELSALSNQDLVARRKSNSRLSDMWDRKSDARGVYGERMELLAKENTVIDRLLAERASDVDPAPEA